MVLTKETHARLEAIQKNPHFRENINVVIDALLNKALSNFLTGSGEHLVRAQGFYNGLNELKNMINSGK